MSYFATNKMFDFTTNSDSLENNKWQDRTFLCRISTSVSGVISVTTLYQTPLIIWSYVVSISQTPYFRTSIGLYGFYNYTKTAPEYQAVERRYKLMYTHKFAAKNPGFNIDDFNEKMRKLANLNENLLRLRDPLRLQLPIRQIRHSSTVDLY